MNVNIEVQLGESMSLSELFTEGWLSDCLKGQDR